MSDELDSRYLRITCYPHQQSLVESCYECPQKGFCRIYAYIMDLTAYRDICPLDRAKEKCVHVPQENKFVVCIKG